MYMYDTRLRNKSRYIYIYVSFRVSDRAGELWGGHAVFRLHVEYVHVLILACTHSCGRPILQCSYHCSSGIYARESTAAVGPPMARFLPDPIHANIHFQTGVHQQI